MNMGMYCNEKHLRQAREEKKQVLAEIEERLRTDKKGSRQYELSQARLLGELAILNYILIDNEDGVPAHKSM